MASCKPSDWALPPSITVCPLQTAASVSSGLSNLGSQRQLVCRAALTPSCQVGPTPKAEENSGGHWRPVTLQCEVTSRFQRQGNLEVRLLVGKRVIGANYPPLLWCWVVSLKSLLAEAVTSNRLFQLRRTVSFYDWPSILLRVLFFHSLTAQFLFNKAVKCMKASLGAACSSLYYCCCLRRLWCPGSRARLLGQGKYT